MKKCVFMFLSLVLACYLAPCLMAVSAEPGADQHKIEASAHADEQTAEHGEDSHGDGHHAPHLDGKNLSLLWALPFLGILLSIAIFPLVAPHFWHHHYGKVSLFWGVIFFIAFTIGFGPNTSFFYLVETYLGEFIPFITLLLALFTVAGGIRLKGELVGSPKLNSLLILIGTALASWMGTTGAAMLMIRPIIRANAWRKNKVHVIVFFIFLVANIGGSLTPLGDPPLFLGFLKGVSFFWTTTHMLPPMLVAVAILLAVFFIVDTIYYNKETEKPAKLPGGVKIAIDGKVNFILLAGVIAAVIFSGVWHSDINNPADVAISAWGAGMLTKGTLVQVIILLAITFLSMKITAKETRDGNGFTWEPILEVAKLFATIFITMVMPIAMLKAGVDGPLGPIIAQVTANGEPVNKAFFWATGALSSFLDNAPTYVVFFNTAGGNAVQLMGELAQTLLAISAGAVFMGANTYIGNAPNFMVKSIAEESGIPMPSFFGYMLKYSIPILIPVFILISIIFF
jgi:Na+/H+ antiporter NhaD/arsenite permease-like protein